MICLVEVVETEDTLVETRSSLSSKAHSLPSIPGTRYVRRYIPCQFADYRGIGTNGICSFGVVFSKDTFEQTRLTEPLSSK